MIRVKILLSSAAVAAAVLAVAPSAQSHSAVTLDTAFQSVALKRDLHFLIHLPADYDTSGKRYPVIYFLHGLPAGPTAYQSVGWVADALDGTGLGAILVVPQGTQIQNGDPEYHDWGPGRNWETALSVELPRYVDANWRTIASRSGRAIVGVSAGGYGAAILGVHHLATFGVIESWSGYFEPTDPSGESTLDFGNDADNAHASVHALASTLRTKFARYPTLFGFYVGKQDPTFVADNLQLNHELRSARVAHVFELYDGGHSTALWQQYATTWLSLALRRLQAAA